MLDWNHIIASAGTLFLVLDPPGNAPLVQSLLQQIPEKQCMRILVRELCFVLLLMLLVFFLGKGFLGCLGISPSSLNLCGGIMLFIIAVGMVFPTKNSPHLNLSNTGLFIVPVTVPLIVGPASMSLIMMQAALCTTTTQKIEGLAAIGLSWLGTVAILCASGRLLSLLGEKGNTALTRLMGTLLILLAVQMVLNGITKYLTEISHLIH